MGNRVAGIVLLFAASSLSCWVNAGEDPAQKLTDEQITKSIVGKWAIDEKSDNGISFKGTEQFKKDGTLETEANIDFGTNPPLKLVISGTWKVKDGSVITTITKTSNPMYVKEGRVFTDKVISLTDDSYQFGTEDGRERTFKRVKEKD